MHLAALMLKKLSDRCIQCQAGLRAIRHQGLAFSKGTFTAFPDGTNFSLRRQLARSCDT